MDLGGVTGDVTEPAKQLVAIFDRLTGGTFFEMGRRRTKAQAAAEVAKIEALSRQEVALIEAQTAVISRFGNAENLELLERTVKRFLTIESAKQLNIENIFENALPLLSNEARPAEVNPDWMAKFVDQASDASEDELRRLWSKILAGECNRPGQFSKRTLTILSDMSANDAELFSRFAGTCWRTDLGFTPSHEPVEFFRTLGLDMEAVMHMEALGLAVLETSGIVTNWFLHERDNFISFGNRTYEIKPRGPTNVINLRHGDLAFTRFGKELLSIVDCTPNEAVRDFMINLWEKTGGVTLTLVPEK